jgi:hypothetical protein
MNDWHERYRRTEERDRLQRPWHRLYDALDLTLSTIERELGITDRTRRRYEREGSAPAWYVPALIGIAYRLGKWRGDVGELPDPLKQVAAA